MDESLKARIREILSPILSSHALELFDIERMGRTLRVTLDRPDGAVTLDDCTEVSRFLSHALDAADIIPGAYRLEVSSPGLDRPLRGLDDCRRFCGQLCRVQIAHPADGNAVVVGRIREVTDAAVVLALENGTARAVDWTDVVRARLEVEF